MTSAKNRLRDYLKSNANTTITKQTLSYISGVKDYARRIRELRAEGMNISYVAAGAYIYTTNKRKSASAVRSYLRVLDSIN